MSAMDPMDEDNPAESGAEPQGNATPDEGSAAAPGVNTPTSKRSSRSAPTADKVTLKESYTILPNKPVEELDTLNASAFEVSERTEADEPLYALVCAATLPLNLSALDTMKGVKSPGILYLVEWGFIEWSSDRSRRLALIYQRPGAKVIRKPSDTITPMKEKQLTEQVVKPLAQGLKEYHGRGLTHRGVCPINMYYNHTGTEVVLGDVLTMPPGMVMSRWAETTENAMTDPEGRGSGLVSDDLYSLGATVLFFAHGSNPAIALDGDKLIHEKLNTDSFEALSGKSRFVKGIEELLVGLLADDVQMRWVMSDVKAWIDGNRQATKQKRSKRTASRPFPFAGEDHLNIQTLAFSMVRDWSNATDIIGSNALDRWVRRSLGDEKMADDVLEAIGTAGIAEGASQDQKDMMVARVLLVLDDKAPIFYRDVSCRLDGLASWIASNLNDESRKNSAYRVIEKEIPELYVENRARLSSKEEQLADLAKKLVQNVTKRRGIGFGVERLMYELDQNMPCQSPVVKRRYVLTTKDLMQTLEAIASKSNRPKLPYDSHIVSFIAARNRNDIKDSSLMQLGPTFDNLTRLTAMTRLFSRAQTLSSIGPMPHLCSWILELLAPSISSFKNIKRRKRIEKQVASAAESGDISQVLMQIDNDAERKRDESEFIEASREYTNIVGELDRLEQDRRNRREIAQYKGEQISVSIATIIAAVIVLLLLTSRLS